MLRAVNRPAAHKIATRTGLVLATVAILSCCSQRSDRATPDEGESVTVFVAASLVDLVTDAATQFEHETQIRVNLNPASSGTLARQIESGAEADLFLSASPDWAEYLDERGLIDRRTVFATNRMVLITPAESPIPRDRVQEEIDAAATAACSEPTARSGNEAPPWMDGLISIGDPAHVPAGRYAREVLTTLGWWGDVEDRLLLASDVRVALLAVERGEVEVGIVYRTDAERSADVTTVAVFPESTHEPIHYVSALLQDASDDTVQLYQFFAESASVRGLLARYGFGAP